MSSAPPHSDGAIEVDGIALRVRASTTAGGAWDVFDDSGLIGTLAQSHPYRPQPEPGYIVRSRSQPVAEVVESWDDGLRLLLRHRL